MTQTAHTPGRWDIFEGKSNLCHIETSNDHDTPGIHICSVPKNSVNKYILTAAPDLLEALERISQFAYDDDTSLEDIAIDFDAMRDIAHDAIAKAEGAFVCKGCGREENACSANPCEDVIEDRQS